MLHLWLLPVVALLVVGVCGLYFLLHRYGGDGKRSEGDCVLDRDAESDAESEAMEKAAYRFIRTPPGFRPIHWSKPGNQDAGLKH